jgi:dipeptidyl aminopeptidase/acylaminoacyl peptidase
MKVIFTILLSFLVFTTHAQKKFEFDDVNKFIYITDPQISPDGKSILLVVTSPDYEENKNNSEICLVEVSTGNVRKLTNSRPSARHPRWSPSGEYVAYIAMDGIGEEAQNQIFVLAMNGGEPVKITNSGTGVQKFAWKPDGRDIAFVQEDEPENKKELERGYDAFEIKFNSMFLNAKPMLSHIWLASIRGGESKRLTSGQWSLPAGDPAPPLSWSPDGKKIVFQKNESPYSGERVITIQILDVESGNSKPLTNRKPGKKEILHETYPSFSPDGNLISYQFPRDGVINGSEFFVAPSAGGEGQNLTHKLDRYFYRCEWGPDSKSVLVAANDGNSVSMWLQGINGSTKRLKLGNLCARGEYWYHYSFGKNGSIAVVASSSTSPPELYYFQSIDSNPRKLTSFNAELASLFYGKQETISWKSDSFTVNGIITFPPDFDKNKKYPLVLRIHGGPQSASKEHFNVHAHYTASKGYIVFEPNYRGSDNLGSAFCTAINGDAGEGPGKDVMRGIEELMKRQYIDESRIAVSGWSYGGYMTTWLIGNYQIWKCAVAGASVTDLTDQYAQADNGIFWKYINQDGETPFTDENVKNDWAKQSPLTYVKNVKTPTLLLSTTGDERVPISQSYKYFRGLQDNKVESKFIVFPVSGHFPEDPVRVKEVNRFWLEWIDKYLKQ